MEISSAANPASSANVKGTALDKIHTTKDDIKWSLFMDRNISNHVQIMGQIANDHYRPKPMATGLINSAEVMLLLPVRVCVLP